MNNNEIKTPERKRVRSTQKNTYFNYPLAFFLCSGSGALILALVWLVSVFADIKGSSLLILATVLYAVAVFTVVALLAILGRTATRRELILHRFDRMLDNMVFPYMITNEKGIIVKHNHAAHELFEKKAHGLMPSVSEVLPFVSPEIIARSVHERVELQYKKDGDEEGTRYIIIQSTETLIGDLKKTADPTKGMYYLTTLIDITEDKRQLISVARKLENETIVMGRAEIDDLKAFSNSSGISEKDASDKVRELLNDWVLHLDCTIFEPETRKFIIMMPLSSLGRCIRDKFPILDVIREAVSTKEDELTVSMGFSATGANLSERMRNADIAFEQRKSGNKAVINTAGEITYFGRDRRMAISGGSNEYRRIGNTLRRFISESG